VKFRGPEGRASGRALRLPAQQAAWSRGLGTRRGCDCRKVGLRIPSGRCTCRLGVDCSPTLIAKERRLRQRRAAKRTVRQKPETATFAEPGVHPIFCVTIGTALTIHGTMSATISDFPPRGSAVSNERLRQGPQTQPCNETVVVALDQGRTARKAGDMDGQACPAEIGTAGIEADAIMSPLS
jgi:hypothetical protein